MKKQKKRIWNKLVNVILLCCAFSLCCSVTGAAKERQVSVCIDPGHQGSWVNMSEPEPNAPDSDVMKSKCTTGTQGTFSGVPEYELNLSISLMLKDELEDRGYRVVMTREDNNKAISNRERALLASEENCDFTVRIHGNSSEDESVKGALAMVMSPENPYVGFLYEPSLSLARSILSSYCEETGFDDLGIQQVDNMTGINWSKVPVMILEMGFMSNQQDDLAMQDEKMQKKMVKGIADGIDDYVGSDDHPEPPPEEANEELTEAQSEALSEAQSEMDEDVPPFLDGSGILEDCIFPASTDGELWSLAYEDLKDGSQSFYHENLRMQSASVIKVFIMGAVYDRICYPADEKSAIYFEESYEGELRSLLEQMIRVSDNNAANRLVEILGEGDFSAGAKIVDQFAKEHGYTKVHMGRRFLESEPKDDNYVSARDCMAILSDIYHQKLVGPEASEKMLDILKGQTVKHKIPEGLPDQWTSANKTGEMPDGYGLGCIENDMAIVFSPTGDYILVVLSNELGGKNSQAQEIIRQVSAKCAQWYSKK